MSASAGAHNQHGFLWIQQVDFLKDIEPHVVHGVLVFLILAVVFTMARISLVKAQAQPLETYIVPNRKMTFRNFFEILAEKLYGLVESVMGVHAAPVYFPFIGTLFCYIFLSNILGLIPGFTPPTDNFNTTFALGMFVFVYYNVVGIKENGILGHLKHLWGPIWWLGPLMFVIEVTSHLIRPLSLSLRLKWNMSGDHIVLAAFSSLAPPFTELFVPIVFMMLGLFVSFIQAFVFSLMTMVYISMSTAHDH